MTAGRIWVVHQLAVIKPVANAIERNTSPIESGPFTTVDTVRETVLAERLRRNETYQDPRRTTFEIRGNRKHDFVVIRFTHESRPVTLVCGSETQRKRIAWTSQ